MTEKRQIYKLPTEYDFGIMFENNSVTIYILMKFHLSNIEDIKDEVILEIGFDFQIHLQFENRLVGQWRCG